MRGVHYWDEYPPWNGFARIISYGSAFVACTKREKINTNCINHEPILKSKLLILTATF